MASKSNNDMLVALYKQAFLCNYTAMLRAISGGCPLNRGHAFDNGTIEEIFLGGIPADPLNSQLRHLRPTLHRIIGSIIIPMLSKKNRAWHSSS